ncbi:DUF2931 family protein [Vibrio sp. TRT 17S01]|uniref:DUF2931 family protein n=1 Tax=Vibrio sp. TRT 17S01 TaxID=3418505 RepID=UPI003CE8B75D
MKYVVLLASLLLSVSINAFSKVPDIPQDLPKWRIGYAMSSFYPVKVTQAYGINEEQDWTSYIHNEMHFWRRSKLDYVRRTHPDYDGYGIALGSPVAKKDQVAGATSLPDFVYIYWASLANAKFYVTKFELTDEIKKNMMIKDEYIRFDGVNRECYRTDIIFGFLPNGNTKVWLYGCGGYTYLTEIAADSEVDRDTFGNDAEIYKKNYADRIVKRAEAEGAKLFPIPWDKVNKVYEWQDLKSD